MKNDVGYLIKRINDIRVYGRCSSFSSAQIVMPALRVSENSIHSISDCPVAVRYAVMC